MASRDRRPKPTAQGPKYRKLPTRDWDPGAIADPAIAKAQALMSVAAGVRREAYVSAYSDAFWIVGVGLIVSLCAIVLLRKSRPPKGPVEAH
jgi:hypothetical protein